MTVEGIDVSAAQSIIDGEKVARAGKAFAFIRIEIGLAADSRFGEHLTELQGNGGLLCSGYVFDDPTKDEHEVICRTLDAAGSRTLDLPLLIDVEVMGSMSPSALCNRLRALTAEAIDQHGRKPLLYTMPYFWSQLGIEGKAQDWADLPLCIAHYGEPSPTVPEPWRSGKGWTFWQHHANCIWSINGKTGFGSWRMPKGARILAMAGSCPGVDGECDLDKFDGSPDDLKALASGPSGTIDLTPTPPPSPMPEPPEAA